MSWILASLSEEVPPIAIGVTSASEIWKALEMSFSHTNVDEISWAQEGVTVNHILPSTS